MWWSGHLRQRRFLQCNHAEVDVGQLRGQRRQAAGLRLFFYARSTREVVFKVAKWHQSAALGLWLFVKVMRESRDGQMEQCAWCKRGQHYRPGRQWRVDGVMAGRQGEPKKVRWVCVRRVPDLEVPSAGSRGGRRAR